MGGWGVVWFAVPTSRTSPASRPPPAASQPPRELTLSRLSSVYSVLTLCQQIGQFPPGKRLLESLLRQSGLS